MTSTQVLYSGSAVDVHTNGNTPDIVCDQASYAMVDINLLTLAGGVAPTILFTIYRKDALGHYNPIRAGAALAAIGFQGLDCGPDSATVLGGVQGLTGMLRVGWVVTGGPTGATADISVIGKW